MMYMVSRLHPRVNAERSDHRPGHSADVHITDARVGGGAEDSVCQVGDGGVLVQLVREVDVTAQIGQIAGRSLAGISAGACGWYPPT